MAKDKDVFGFDELDKSFKRLSKKYPEKADALLMTMSQAAQKRVKALTPVKTKKLQKSWRLKKVKLYKGGTVRVVRLQSTAPHAHLVNDPHKIYTTNGRKTGRVGRYNAVGRKVRGIKSHGMTEGVHMLERGIDETRNRFQRNTEDMLDKLIKSEGLDA